MAKKLLCIVLSVAMLLGVCAVASSAAYCWYGYTPEEAEAELAEKLWEVEYDASEDYKDLINRRWLTGVQAGNYGTIPAVAADEEILQQNLYFWEDEIIEAYNAAASNEDYWALYNKMATPMIASYDCPDCGEVECDILYDYAYEYRAEEKAVMELEIVADKEYAKAGDTITVDVYATSNFRTPWWIGGIFYNKQYLEPVSVAFDTVANPGWEESKVQLDAYNSNGEDNRVYFWPDAMQTEENFAKYGVSWVRADCDVDLGFGNYEYGKIFTGKRLFTAVYTVKEDVPAGEELEFFVPEGSTDMITYVLEAEQVGRAGIFQFKHVVYDATDASNFDITTDDHSIYDQTVTANKEVVIAGEEPAPAVKGEIVDVTPSETYIGDTAVVSVEVTGTPDFLRVVKADGYQVITREDADIEATENGEIWVIEIFVEAEEVPCTVYADYGDLGVTDGTDFVLTGIVKLNLDVISLEIPDMYPDAKSGGVILSGVHEVIVKTSTDVMKVQFYNESTGETYTYATAYTQYEDIDGVRVWTINHNFAAYGDISLVVRTRAAKTTFAPAGATLDATVVY